MVLCCIALGGNTGDVAGAFAQALALLEDKQNSVVEVSRSMVAPAMGDSAGGDFLNAAAVVNTSQDASSFLKRLHDIEERLGRRRTVHWGPRPIDLDLLLFGQYVIASDEIVVPHPCLWYRHFVLKPLSEVAGEWKHPVLGETVVQMLDRLNRRPIRLEIPAGSRTATAAKSMNARGMAEIEAGELEFVLVTQGTPVSAGSFAQLVEPSMSDRSEPKRTAKRTMPLSLTGTDEEAVRQLQGFLREFVSAAIG